MPDVIKFSGLTKRYGAACVLDDASLLLVGGRVHALMGENGAGKSTLIKLIAGALRPDQMTARKNGQELALRSQADAMAAGFRFIHQEMNIVPQLSVAENILLGQPTPTRWGGLVDWPEMARRAANALHQLGAPALDMRRAAGSLSPVERMLVKLAAAFVGHDGAQPPCLYVLDEPTAALSQTEAEALFAVISRLKSQGAAILYVSHRLNEVMQICDDVTVLRNGRAVMTAPLANTSKDDIILAMTGRAVADAFPPRPDRAAWDSIDDVICSAQYVATKSLSGLNFTLRAGEILGVGGLASAGQTALLHLFLGLEPPLRGMAKLMRAPVPQSPSAAWARGVAYVPQERRTEGLMMAMGTRPNAMLSHYKGVFARIRNERALTADLIARLGITAAGPEQPVWQLSGGNQQKVIFARALAQPPRLLLLDDPTRGVDVGAKYEIYSHIRDLSAKGCAILLASSDLPELLGLSERILVLQSGKQTGILPTAGLGPSDLLRAFYAAPSAAKSLISEPT
jgi:ribose transport system ATP-binding protein